jgi:molecular chaperone GrpE
MSQEQEHAPPPAASSEAVASASGQSNGTADDVAKLQAELEASRAQAAQALDRLLRAQAEMENTRRRAEIDVANAHKYAIERFAGELLAVRDSLEIARSLEIGEENATVLKKMHEGLDLTLKLMDDAFRKFALVQLDPKGEKFDPARHHAISMVESAEVPPNHVINVMQKGYLLNDRVLRPAMVVVAKAPAAPSAS